MRFSRKKMNNQSFLLFGGMFIFEFRYVVLLFVENC